MQRVRRTRRTRWSITRIGVAVLLGSVVVLAAGIAFAMPELIAAGMIGPALAAVGAVALGLRRPRIRVDRLVPDRAWPGQDMSAIVELRVAGSRRGHRTVRTGVVMLADVTSNGPEDDVFFGPLRSTQVASIRQNATANRRGRFQWGPARVSETDPFGLIRRRDASGEPMTTIVRPRIYVLDASGAQRAYAVEAEASEHAAPTLRSEDLTGLRQYQAGDDIRHVHWAGFARTGDMLVRQFEHSDSSRLTLVVDDGASPQFEGVLEIAASIVMWAHELGQSLTLIHLRDPRQIDASSTEEFEGLLDHLALISPSDAPSAHSSAFESIRRASTVVAVTAGTEQDLAGIYEHLGAGVPAVVLALLDPSAPPTATSPTDTSVAERVPTSHDRLGSSTVVLAHPTELPERWASTEVGAAARGPSRSL